MKTQTKTEIRNNTAKAGRLLRGIDNQMLSVKKDQEKITKKMETVAKDAAEVNKLLNGLSNTALHTPAETKPAAKTAAKPAVKTAAKKTAVKAAVKDSAKASAKPAAKKATDKKTVNGDKKMDDRPPLKAILADLLDEARASNGGKAKVVSAADLYRQTTSKYAFFSRQAVYNALNNEKNFKKMGDEGYVRVASSTSNSTTDEEAAEFVSKVDKSDATAAVS